MIRGTAVLLLTSCCFMILAVIGFGIAGEFGGQINSKNMLLITAQLAYDYSIYSVGMMSVCLLIAHMIERAVYLRVGLDNCLNVVRDVTILRYDDDQTLRRFEKDAKVIERQRAELEAQRQPEGAQELLEEPTPAVAFCHSAMFADIICGEDYPMHRLSRISELDEYLPLDSTPNPVDAVVTTTPTKGGMSSDVLEGPLSDEDELDVDAMERVEEASLNLPVQSGNSFEAVSLISRNIDARHDYRSCRVVDSLVRTVKDDPLREIGIMEVVRGQRHYSLSPVSFGTHVQHQHFPLSAATNRLIDGSSCKLSLLHRPTILPPPPPGPATRSIVRTEAIKQNADIRERMNELKKQFMSNEEIENVSVEQKPQDLDHQPHSKPESWEPLSKLKVFGCEFDRPPGLQVMPLVAILVASLNVLCVYLLLESKILNPRGLVVSYSLLTLLFVLFGLFGRCWGRPRAKVQWFFVLLPLALALSLGSLICFGLWKWGYLRGEIVIDSPLGLIFVFAMIVVGSAVGSLLHLFRLCL